MEQAMSTISLSQLKNQVAGWCHDARAHHELTNLSDRILRDIGISRCTADFKTSKSFWTA